ADGAVRWMNCRCFPIRDEHGHCRRLVVVSADVTEQRAARERLDFLAYYDEVTGLPNRHLFELRLAEAVQAARARGGKLAVVVSDIDGFKNINDTLGPAAGNELLRQVGTRLADAASDDAVIRAARIGADQFVGLATRVRPREEMDRHMQSALRAIFGKPFVVEGSELRVAAKLGIAIYPDHGGDAVTVFRNAEAALKKAKATGEPYLFFDEKMTQQVAAQLALVNKLRRALERSEFVLHYQPKVEIDSRRVVGVEALLRWNDPSSGRQVPPAEFIPLLEDTGLIAEVGAWAIGQAARDQEIWRASLPAGTPPPRVAVNVSAIQLRRGDFVKTVEEAMGAAAPAVQGAAAPPAQAAIDLEITESLIMEDFEGNVGKLRALRAMGVNVAIDDFGTGYSSLAYLARLPVETLKIDRSFVDAMLGDPNIMTVVTAIMTLAHSFGLKVVAEGVETERQLHLLRLLRCDQMQGYLFSRPVPAEQIPALLKTGGPEKPVT
ncbi:MAG TPA: EAL domain-containing protein, partial [Burkholderiales bacterium]|nr:EAL domain-containing protein [Burkholderiales bacterium]